MQLSDKQIQRFKEIHSNDGKLEGYSELEIRKIANGVANYYLTLFEIKKRIERENTADTPQAPSQDDD